VELILKRNDVVLIDTAPLIYYWEENPRYFKQVSSFLDNIYNVNAQIVVSLVSYIEILTYPIKKGDNKLVLCIR